MRSEPTSVERLQFLRGAPAPLVEQDNTPLTALENERTRRRFWRVSGLIAGVVVIGIAAAMVWQLAGPQTSESAATFASPSRSGRPLRRKPRARRPCRRRDREGAERFLGRPSAPRGDLDLDQFVGP